MPNEPEKEPLFAMDKVVVCERCGKRRYLKGPPFCCLEEYEFQKKQAEGLWRSLKERTENNAR